MTDSILAVFPSVSASQISNHELCNRRWYFEKRLGIKQPETDEMRLGTAVHTAMEDWYLHGKMPNPDSGDELASSPEFRQALRTGYGSAKILIDGGKIPERDVAVRRKSDGKVKYLPASKAQKYLTDPNYEVA